MSSSAVQTSKFTSGAERTLPVDQLHLLDWEKLYLDMLEFKEERGYHNLVIRPEHPHVILEATDPKLYGLICDDRLLRPQCVSEIGRLQTVMSAVLKKYVESFYRKRQQSWDSDRMVYAPLKKDDDNFQDYTVRVPRSNPDLVKAVKGIIDEGKRIYKELCADLPGVYLDRHLYQPLLVKRGKDLRTSPPSLNPGEERFVEDLIALCRTPPAWLKDKELFLLRNLSRGKGIGFFEDNGFFPDFLFWITESQKQRLVFIEPHGLLRDVHPTINPKVNLQKKLKEAAKPALKRSAVKNLDLDSFVISVTPYDELRTRVVGDDGPWTREQFAEAHILFFEEDRNYLEKIIA